MIKLNFVKLQIIFVSTFLLANLQRNFQAFDIITELAQTTNVLRAENSLTKGKGLKWADDNFLFGDMCPLIRTCVGVGSKPPYSVNHLKSETSKHLQCDDKTLACKVRYVKLQYYSFMGLWRAKRPYLNLQHCLQLCEIYFAYKSTASGV